jgi:glycine/D-amino acid oxidase-like deaminating enzyme
MSDADVLIVGGGIAGWSAAYFAALRGRRVTLVDEGVQRASDLPVALVNPLRGHAGRLIARGVDGMHATFALVDALRERGHAIDAGRGLHRPLIDRNADATHEAYWRERLAGSLAFDWHARAPSSLGLVDPVPTLYLRDAGWVAPAGLLRALSIEARVTLLVDRVIAFDTASVTLAGGTAVRARSLLWCGGAWGCAGIDRDHADANDAIYKPGSLLSTSATLTREPLSFGLYALPRPASANGTLIGPTREDSQSRFPDGAVAAEAIRHLEDRVARTFGETIARTFDTTVDRSSGSTVALEHVWRGVRLAKLSTHASHALRGVPMLTALGSRGYLMAPLLAAAWALSL